MSGMHQLPHADVVHLADIAPRRTIFTLWERHRHRQAHWFIECAAETMGVFFYVYFGVGAIAGFNIGGLTGQAINSLETVGFGFAFGIMLALVVCSATSGGHFNPAMTITMVIFKGFPPIKAARYIVAQILGAYLAALLVYAQYHQTIHTLQAELIAKGTFAAVNYTPQGLAGIFACYAPAGAHLGLAFLNEFVCDFMIGLVIWACIDPTNFLSPPAAAPWIISLTYAVCVWGFALNGISTNAARDLGTRFAVLTIWGSDASGGAYAAIAALTNIPATICGVLFYEFILLDSSRVITPIHVSHLNAHLSHQEHCQHGTKPVRHDEETGKTHQSSYDDDSKAQIETFERTSKNGAQIQTIERA
ncbi:aquaporin-like protein [Irpex rosettiformis]|uniref:Aquaporin-like protein n=1 Tax=Irpex rosettiformis TaxID=378272 RepID=A0ACB8UGR5_9APHY|nr:aquaporin-like protein [Irpex rosettiformis]